MFTTLMHACTGVTTEGLTTLSLQPTLSCDDPVHTSPQCHLERVGCNTKGT